MKLIIASDIHGSLTATNFLLDTFNTSNANWLVLLGDFLNHGPNNPIPEDYNPVEVATALNYYREKIIAVRGNCDSEVDEILLNFPFATPWQQIFISNKRRLFLTHGHIYYPAKLPPLTTGDVFLYGHTHIPQAKQLGENIIFNPGSVSLPKDKFSTSYGMLVDNKLQILSLCEKKVISQIVINF